MSWETTVRADAWWEWGRSSFPLGLLSSVTKESISYLSSRKWYYIVICSLMWYLGSLSAKLCSKRPVFTVNRMEWGHGWWAELTIAVLGPESSAYFTPRIKTTLLSSLPSKSLWRLLKWRVMAHCWLSRVRQFWMLESYLICCVRLLQRSSHRSKCFWMQWMEQTGPSPVL